MKQGMDQFRRPSSPEFWRRRRISPFDPHPAFGSLDVNAPQLVRVTADDERVIVGDTSCLSATPTSGLHGRPRVAPGAPLLAIPARVEPHLPVRTRQQGGPVTLTHAAGQTFTEHGVTYRPRRTMFGAPSFRPMQLVRPAGDPSTVDAIAAALGEAWMPTDATKYDLLISCASDPSAADQRSECSPAMAFLRRHARMWTDPQDATHKIVVGEPLRQNDPWVPLSVWIERYWDRQTTGYNPIPNTPNDRFFLVPTADGSPPANTQPLPPPPPPPPSRTSVQPSSSAAPTTQRAKILGGIAIGVSVVVIGGGAWYLLRGGRKAKRR